MSAVGLLATYALTNVSKTGLSLIFETALNYLKTVNPLLGAAASTAATAGSVYLTKKVLLDRTLSFNPIDFLFSMADKLGGPDMLAYGAFGA